MIAIIDYDAGNIRSVENALQRLGADYTLTSDPAVIRGADRVILPGVGNAAEAARSLRERGLAELIPTLRQPVLGICVGMQLLCRHSAEGDAPGLGIFDCDVLRFQEDAVRQAGASRGNAPTPATDKIPHMGWNRISNLESKLFKGLADGAWVYFVHSYYPTLCTDTIATCRYAGVMFSAALRYENFYGTQFHPEKSGETGEQILKNFLAL